jgi:hypothetical protein
VSDDSRYLQISAPVQPGNSGGPLLDAGGHIAGIVTAKLDAALVARFTGDIPQNVNFALKAEVARTFLDSKGISYQSAHSDVQLPPADVGDIARPFTVEIECYANPQTNEHVQLDRTTARVVLYEEDLNDPLGKRYIGSATWRTEMLPSGPDLASEIGVGADTRDTAERRQVTVMFSDLVGSTALSARMDPEDLREVISAYQKCVAESVDRFGGFVAKYMGDGVLIYFGYPQAHEDDAERAVRAGLELVAAVGGLKTHAALQTRVGIATGLVVVGDLIGSGASQEQAIVGETPNR